MTRTLPMPTTTAQGSLAIKATDLVKTFRTAQDVVHAVRGVSLEVRKGEVVSLEGPSGSGKTTLLCILGCMLTPDSGRLFIDGVEVKPDRPKQLPRFRREAIGFVFQQFNLFPALNVTENILYALKIKGMRGAPARQEAARVIEAVGLGTRKRAKPRELSGGQKQRVAIARALAGPAKVILADEPTANLDARTGAQILDLFRDLARQENRGVVIVTHDPKVRRVADRICRIDDGLLKDHHDETEAIVDASAIHPALPKPAYVNGKSHTPRRVLVKMASTRSLVHTGANGCDISALASFPSEPEWTPALMPTAALPEPPMVNVWQPKPFPLQAMLPSPWSEHQVGWSSGVAGSARFEEGKYLLTGSGAGLSGNFDQYHCVDRMHRGDGVIVARVTPATAPGGASTAGLMFRATSDPDAAFVGLVTAAGQGVSLCWRAAEGYEASSLPYSENDDTGRDASPVWLKLVRAGDVLTGSVSRDGVDFANVGSVSLGMARNVFIGLIVAGDDDSDDGNDVSCPGLAEFDHVDVSSS